MLRMIGLLLALLVGGAGVAQAEKAAEPLELASIAGGQVTGTAFYPTVSADGRWVAFASTASLVPHDSGGTWDVYVRELATGKLERIAITNDPDLLPSMFQAPVLSADGRFIAFEACAYSRAGSIVIPQNLFLYDRSLGTFETLGITTNSMPTYYPGSKPAISDDGRYVAFQAANGIYLRDRQQGTTMRLAATGFNPTISGNGRFIAYHGSGTLEVWDQEFQHTELLARFMSFRDRPSMSRDGRFVVYEGWTYGSKTRTSQVFLYDRQARTNRQLLSASFSNALGYSESIGPQITADSRYILYHTPASVLDQTTSGNQLYLYDLAAQTTLRLPLENLWSVYYFPLFDISGDGSVVVFQDVVNSIMPALANNHYSAFGVFAFRTGVPTGNSPVLNDSGLNLTAEPSVLWPPNSRFTAVKLCVPAAPSTTVEFQIADEYGVLSQTVRGNDVTVQLEAWRNSDDSDGRTYTVTAIATEASGQQQTASTTVTVPHDQR